MSFFNARFRDRNLSFTHVKPVEGDVEGLEPVVLHDPKPVHEQSLPTTTSTASKSEPHLPNITEHEHESATSESNDEFASASEGEDDMGWESTTAVIETPVLQHDASRFTTTLATSTALSHWDVPDVQSISFASKATTVSLSYSESSDAVVPSLTPATVEAEVENTTVSKTTDSIMSSSASTQSSTTAAARATATNTITTTATTTTTTATTAASTSIAAHQSYYERVGDDQRVPFDHAEEIEASSSSTTTTPRSSHRISFQQRSMSTSTSSSYSPPGSATSSTPTPRASTSPVLTRSRNVAPAPRLRERMRQSPVPKSKIVQAYLDPSASGDQLPSPTSVRQAWLRDYPSFSSAATESDQQAGVELENAAHTQTDNIEQSSEEHSTSVVHTQHSPLQSVHQIEQ
ncbi:hypothetical protein BGW41_005080, partial [Actinomortierella wolfii]